MSLTKRYPFSAEFKSEKVTDKAKKAFVEKGKNAYVSSYPMACEMVTRVPVAVQFAAESVEVPMHIGEAKGGERKVRSPNFWLSFAHVNPTLR